MHQDEAGRWLSDNGRYLWSGSEWVDLERAGGRRPQRRPRSRGPRPGRRLFVLLGLLALVAVGVVAVLVVGNRSTSRPTSSAPGPLPGAATPGALPSSPTASPALDEQQRRDRAERALVSRTDVPSTTEQRPVDPTDVFLPCRAPALTAAGGTVLVGRTVSNSDFTVYVGQTIAGYATAREATEALAAVQKALGRCAPYAYPYANSPRVDRITYTDVGSPLDVADGGVYLAEVDTPSNYSGTTTTYSYGYVRSGQFLVRLTLTNRNQADRAGTVRLLQRITDQLG